MINLLALLQSFEQLLLKSFKDQTIQGQRHQFKLYWHVDIWILETAHTHILQTNHITTVQTG